MDWVELFTGRLIASLNVAAQYHMPIVGLLALEWAQYQVFAIDSVASLPLNSLCLFVYAPISPTL